MADNMGDSNDFSAPRVNLSQAPEVASFLLGSSMSPFLSDDSFIFPLEDNGTNITDMSTMDINFALDCLNASVFNCSGNSTVSPADDTAYDTGLPDWLAIIIAILVGLVVFLTVLGNMTVLLAFFLERTIRQPTNYFLASLAMSDFLIGLFSMPLYTMSLLMGRWPLGPWLCDLWLSLDWTVCLTSQYTVFLITMDRYLSVKIPAKYRNWRTEKRVFIMIAISWILPAVVFFTVIIGWQFFVGQRTIAPEVCEAAFLQGNPMFTFLLTVAYFWVTMIVMIILYAGIYKVALDLQRKSDAKHKKIQGAMELAGDDPRAIRSFGEGTSNNNSSGNVDGHCGASHPQNIKNKIKKNKSVKKVPALPSSGGAGIVNTTSFTSKQDRDDDRSSSPAFASDDENSSSGGATGGGKSSQVGNLMPPGGTSVLFANTGGFLRAMQTDISMNAPTGDSQALLQPPSYYNQSFTQQNDVSVSDTEGPLQEADSVYSSATSDRLEKQTVPLLQNNITNNNNHPQHDNADINRGCRYIDEKSLLATLSESSCLLPTLPVDSELEDSDVADHHGMSPIWKRRASLPPLASDVFDLEEDMNDCMIHTDIPRTTSLPTPGTNHITTAGHNAANTVVRNEVDGIPRGEGDGLSGQADSGCIEGASSKVWSKSETGNNNCSGGEDHAPPSDTNTNEESSKSDTNCLSAIRARRQKDKGIHAFVKSVRSRNSRKRNRRERKSKSENRARKALRTISFILGAFIVCWTPYHINVALYTIDASLVKAWFYSLSYWLCYVNSPINPFCYAFSNVQFKRTFIRILKLDWHKT